MKRGSASKDQPFRLLHLGEQGLTVELGDTVDPEVNARVHRLAATLRTEALAGVTELVPTYRSLLIIFDPLRISRNELTERITRLAAPAESAALPDAARRVVCIPVCYGGEFGPDLEFVARHAGLSMDEVIALHAAREYPVYLLGFTPGFPYLGGLPERIAAPRLETPRKLVAAGSVGIAGSQTGIYPVASPGGWRIIGRTPLRLFDPGRDQPFLAAAGDLIRFEPVDRAAFERIAAAQGEESCPAAGSLLPEPAGGFLEVVKPGLLSTVQDQGRHGFLAYGVSVSGAMDRMASGIANILAGNDPDAALLEMTLLGGTFRFERGAYLAICGADMGGVLNGIPIRNWSGFSVPPGGELAFGHARNGCRAYLALRGGIAVPPVLGSRSTLLRASIGGLGGRALRTGDLLPLGEALEQGMAQRTLSRRLVPEYPGEIRLRVLPGPQDDHFTRQGLATFFGSVYTITPRNDRMGLCLDGPRVMHRNGADIVSDALCAGAVQVSGDGLPMIMGADHQTTGGYAKLGVVIGADLSRLAQARQGTRVRFVRCTDAAAVAALRREQELLCRIRVAVS